MNLDVMYSISGLRYRDSNSMVIEIINLRSVVVITMKKIYKS